MNSQHKRSSITQGTRRLNSINQKNLMPGTASRNHRFVNKNQNKDSLMRVSTTNNSFDFSKQKAQQSDYLEPIN